MQLNTICVVGLGYIGLPTAAVIASRKKNVIGLDVKPEVVDTINRGEIHIVEPELDILVQSVVNQKRLRATSVPEPADAFLIAVPTPFKSSEGSEYEPDLSFIESAAKAIAPVLEKGNLVILESTSPVGATEKMAGWLAYERPDLSFPQYKGESSDIRVAHCPERVLPGQVVRELVENDRVIGGMTNACSAAACALYKIFVQGECVVTDVRTAEMCKLTENTFRDINIAFANELSLLADRFGINVWELIRVANRHPRVNILQPGAGVGGHCIAVDPWFIVSAAPDLARLTRTARETNDSKPRHVVEKVKEQARGKKCIACLGLAFKPDVDDLRESPALAIVTKLAQELGMKILVVEPHIDALPPALAAFSNVRLVDIHEAAENADLLVGLVRHNAFVSSSSLQKCHGSSLDFVRIWDQ